MSKIWVEGVSQINKMEDKAVSATQDAVANTSSESEKYISHNPRNTYLIVREIHMTNLRNTEEKRGGPVRLTRWFCQSLKMQLQIHFHDQRNICLNQINRFFQSDKHMLEHYTLMSIVQSKCSE